jgi:hypothetical protein
LTIDVAERLFDGSSWGEVSERKLQAGFIKKIDGKKNFIFRGMPPLGLLGNFFTWRWTKFQMRLVNKEYINNI